MDSIDLVQNYLIDSLINVSKNSVAAENSNTINIWRTVGSSGIIILLFIVERIINIYKNNLSSKKEFLHTVILIPNNSNIISLFDTYFDVLEKSINELRSFNGSGDEVDKQRQQKLSILKDLKIDFDHQFLSLVRSVDLKKAVSLTEKLNGLDDIATENLTSINMSSIKFEFVKKEVHKLKSDFYNILYK